MSFGYHKGSRYSRTVFDQVLCPANVHLPGPVVSEVPLRSEPPKRHPRYTHSPRTLAPDPYTYCFLDAELLGRLGDFRPPWEAVFANGGGLEEVSLSSVVKLAQFCSVDESPL